MAQPIKLRLRTDNYLEFEKRELNNAYLLAIQTYEYSLEDFERLFTHFDQDFHKTFAYLKTLEKEKNPDQVLKEFVAR